MKNLGLDDLGNEEEVDYDINDQVFYNDEIKNIVSTKKTQLGKDAIREITSYDSMLAQCDSLLTRKTNLFQL